jgi:hypothetical protein
MLLFGPHRLGSDEIVRDHPENPGRKEHRDVAKIGNVNLLLVTRKYTGNDQVVGASDQRKKAYSWSVRSRVMQARKERRVGSQLATHA